MAVLHDLLFRVELIRCFHPLGPWQVVDLNRHCFPGLTEGADATKAKPSNWITI